MNLLSALFFIYCISGAVSQNDYVLNASNPLATPQISEWRQLFNGKDLTGWKQAGGGDHYVEDGLIKSRGGMGLLYREGEVILFRTLNLTLNLYVDRVPTWVISAFKIRVKAMLYSLRKFQLDLLERV